ncbi:hypothetical protein EVAR_63572_1 [Eumeta japonica]|uniref:Uncharacterized protein n=1 Tax=Eumeta variegata TaxID=151549 RepID=A0A4C1ZSD5_EUMVA|nr:hypothetical protein EVAR_63572_1 [Eumeta japonica]
MDVPREGGLGRAIAPKFPLDHPFSLVCYCVAVFLRAAFRSVGLRACTSVWAIDEYEYIEVWASVPARSSGYPAVCMPSPHTVSAPRVVLVIFASSRGNIFTRTLLLRRGNPEGFLTFAPLAPLCLLAA